MKHLSSVFILFLQRKSRTKIILVVISLLTISTVGYLYGTKSGLINTPLKFNAFSLKTKDEAHILFLSEVYDRIKDNYWDTISDQDLINLYRLAAEKVTALPQPIQSDTKDGLKDMLQNTMKNMDVNQKKEFSKNLANTVLANLKPFGRSALYTTKQEEQLSNLVQNINLEKDLYKDLGVGKDASANEIQQAYEKKKEELAADTSEKAKEELAKTQYAKEVLSKEENKQLYDEKKVEPTIFSEAFGTDILYFYFKRFSPTTFDQFQKTLTTYDTANGPNSLILDFRGNVGGQIDSVPNYLGAFLGMNQYAYDFYQKGEYKPFRTKMDKLAGLSRYKQVVILVDNNTQSSAEIMVASLKNRRFGIVVGVPTKGWGTIERVFPIENQIDDNERLSVFLVHHITIRDDGQPIEGRGVEPTININDPGWEEQLFDYFRNSQLTATVKQIWSKNPQ